ncbi:MAG: N-acetylglucosamine kinase [Thermomicrobiales bacterium]
MTPYLVAVDGGQTSTKALLAARDGTVLGYGVGGPCDRFAAPGGEARNRAALTGAIHAAYTAAGLSPGPVAAVGVGLTGFHTGGPELPQIEAIVRAVVTPDAVAAVGDYVSNLLGASSGQPGVVIIAGGGSIAYGVTLDGREATAGGAGYLLADEGSAYAIGHLALRAAMRASDGRDEPTTLLTAVPAAYGLSSVRELPDLVYRADFTRDRIATLAPVVTRAAESSDAVARRILATAGGELARTTLACIRQLYPPGATVAVYPTGGVFAAGALLMEPFGAALSEGWPAATIQPAAFPPVVGALIIAARAAGQEVDAAWLTRVGATLPPTAR